MILTICPVLRMRSKDIILILRVTPLAQKDVEELRKIIKELSRYARSTGGDIVRLGEERVIVTPPSVKIWRESLI